MKNLSFILIIISTLILVSSCQKKETTEENSYDCTFVHNEDDMDGQIDETEKALMDECRENALNSKVAIENNLIGEWELIGHGQGWTYNGSQPCSYITISENELIFEFANAYIDTTTTHSWEILEIDWTAQVYYNLELSPDWFGLYLNIFSEKLMFGDATPADGNMYLYEKK